MTEARAQRPRPAPAPRRTDSLLPQAGGAGQLLPLETSLAPASAPSIAGPQLEENAPEAIVTPPPTGEVAAPAETADMAAELAVPARPPMEVELLIPPPSPEIEQRSSRGTRAASRGMGGAGSANRVLPPPEENTETARTNVAEPDAETLARADAALTATLGEVPAPSPEIERLCYDIQDAIESRRPVDEDSLRRTNPAEEAQAVGDNLNQDIQGSADTVDTTYNAVNDPTSGTPDQVSAPLPEPARDVATPPVHAAGAAPPATEAENLDLGPDLAATTSSVEDAGMTTEPAQLVQTEPFTAAREGLAELEATAAVAPQEVMRQEQEAIANSQASMRALQVQALQALENSRGGTIQDTIAGQLSMARTEEEKRVAVAAAADTIFTAAQTAVNTLLEPMTRTAMERWNAGKASIVGAFDRELQRAKDLVDERHEGVGGAIVSLWDDATGLPSSITSIYDQAERTFGRDICTLIREISTYVNGIVIACEELIDNADRDIQELFESLPAELQGWAEQQRGGFQERLNGLRDNVHETQTSFTNDLVSQAGDAVQEARERIDALREAAKGFIQKVADAVNAFLEDPVRAIINGLLTLVGIAPGAFWALVARIEQVASDIADDPMNFANNLMAAVGQGFSQFFDNFFSHLLSGFLNWMFSAMGTVGVQLPPDMSVGSIITFFLQLMGITWPNIRAILARHIGEENVALLEQAYELLNVLITQGPAGIYEMIRERLDPAMIMQTIIDAAVSYLVERIVALATARIVMLFNPVGAIAQAIEAIFRVLQWIFQNAARIFTLIETVVAGVADLIAGNIGGMAARVEQALAGLLVPVIDFIASYLGLGDLPERIAEVVGGFQQMVLGAIDRAIGFLVERARGLLASLGLGAGAGAEGEDGELGDQEVGERISFSADGEGHRMWIDTAGSGAKVMVASEVETLEAKVRRWNAEAGGITDNAKKAGAQSLLPEVNRQLGITEAKAETAETAIENALNTPTPEEVEAAKQADDETESAQRELVPMLQQLFEIFGEESPVEKFATEIASLAHDAQDNVREEMLRRIEQYSGTSNWPAAEGILWSEASSVGTLSKQPLGTPRNNRPFQQSSFGQGFLPAVTQALQTVSGETGKSSQRLLVAEADPTTFASNRRRYIHTRQGAPAGEESSRGTAQATYDALLQVLKHGGALSAVTAAAQAYFVQSLRGKSEHSDYAPRITQISIGNGQLSVSYEYEVASNTHDGPKNFVATFSVLDLAQGLVQQSTRGSNLVLSPPGDRGQTHSFGELTADATRVTGPQHSAHLLADQFMGSGYKDALNLVLTSANYNTQVMGGAERAIRAVIQGHLNQFSDDLITFDLQVNVTWQDLHDGEVVRKLQDVVSGLAATANLDAPEDLTRLQQTSVAFLQGRQDPRWVKAVSYRGIVYRNGTVINLVQQDIGPDMGLAATLT